MYNLGDAYIRLNELCDRAHSSIIDVTDYDCNGTHIKILYTRTEIHDILHVSFILNNEYAVCAFYIINGKIDSYIPNDIFSVVIVTFKFAEKISTNEFFDVMCKHILSSSEGKRIIQNDFAHYVNRATIKPGRSHDRLYFSHLRRANLSCDMKNKIKRIKGNDEAYEIIEYLKSINRTLVFVDDFNKRKNLTLENIKCMNISS